MTYTVKNKRIVFMNDQKIENLLNLALEATPGERERSPELEAGYNPREETWQVIIRYSETLRESLKPEWEFTPLSGGYGILVLPWQDLEALAALPQIQYIEKPKRLFFSLDKGRAASCLSAVQNARYDLQGRGVIVAVIDSGADYFHPDFRKEDGSTRILELWDQEADRIYSQEEINRALEAGSREAGYEIVGERDLSGHGTQVLAIAAGNGRASGGQYRGVAPESDLLVVKLGLAPRDGFPRTAEVMTAVEYVIRKAEALGKPVSVNLSFGNVYGSHRGTSLLETYLELMADQWKTVISVGTGNEGGTGGHASGTVSSEEPSQIELLIQEFETGLSLQIWKNYADQYRVTIVHPNGQEAGPLGQEAGTARYRLGRTELLVYYGMPSPYQGLQEIYVEFLPGEAYLDEGTWRILLTPLRIVNGEYDMWLSDARVRNRGTRFLQPSPLATMTIPATAGRVISVGAYDARRQQYAVFSGRGWPEQKLYALPDLAAPGVEVTTAAPGGGYVSVTGTSFAVPFVAGAAALLMEWGITEGNDPFLYGEKVKAYLQRGARQLPGFSSWPNSELGYGVLCVRDSLPE